MIPFTKSKLFKLSLIFLALFFVSCSSNRITIEHFGGNREAMPKSVAETNFKESTSEAYVIVSSLPEIKGGKKALRNNIIVPDSFQKLNEEGLVSVDFIIDESGKAMEFNIVNSFTNEYDKAVINALEKTIFNPGISSGKPARFYQNVEVRFKPAD